MSMKQEERAFLVPGAFLVASYQENKYRCRIVRGPDGINQYDVEGVGLYSSVSAAANAVVSQANPKRAFPNTNGYEFWKFADVDAAAANFAELKTSTAVVLTAADEIEQAQEAFTRVFRKGAEPIDGVRFGYQGGFIEETAYWLEAESVWLASQVAPEGNRFWKRLEEGGPFNRRGSVNQGYLYPLSANFVTRLAGRFRELAERVSITPDVRPDVAGPYLEPDFETIRSRIEDQGIKVGDRALRRFHLSLRSRGFVILCGISGTGKTWLAQAYARAVGGRECLVSVAPNWTTNEDLLGYFNPIQCAYHDTRFSSFLREASREWKSAAEEQRTPVPYHFVLDEMNLARVEYYFATFLSALEVRQREETVPVQLGEDEVLLTPNLRFIGTVNVDETTHGFADKVYDRAQLVELEAPREAIESHLADWQLATAMLDAWDALHEVAPFAFRVIDDIRKYVDEAEKLGVEVEAALDEQMLQKLLPKVHGIEPRIEQALTGFIELCGERFPLSADKAGRMRTHFNEHGSVSYFA